MLIPGDISWAMKLEDAVVDLDSIGALPGQKVLTRGNHDYWWNSPTKIRARLLPGTYVLQNDSIQFGGVTVCGSRGWVSPGGLGYKQEDEKIYQREVLRMGLSLQAAKKPPDGKAGGHDPLPPFNEEAEPRGLWNCLNNTAWIWWCTDTCTARAAAALSKDGWAAWSTA